MLESRRLDDGWISRTSPRFPPPSAGTPPPTAPTTTPNKAQGAKVSPSLEAILLIANDAVRINSDRAIGVSLKPNELAQALRGRD
jgi:hypothetical protein